MASKAKSKQRASKSVASSHGGSRKRTATNAAIEDEEDPLENWEHNPTSSSSTGSRSSSKPQTKKKRGDAPAAAAVHENDSDDNDNGNGNGDDGDNEGKGNSKGARTRLSLSRSAKEGSRRMEESSDSDEGDDGGEYAPSDESLTRAQYNKLVPPYPVKLKKMKTKQMGVKAKASAKVKTKVKEQKGQRLAKDRKEQVSAVANDDSDNDDNDNDKDDNGNSNGDDGDGESKEEIEAPSLDRNTSGIDEDSFLSESVFPDVVDHKLSLRDCKDYLKPLICKLGRPSNKEMDKETKNVMGSRGTGLQPRAIVPLNAQGDNTFAALCYALNAVSSRKDRFDDVLALRREVFTQLETNWTSQWQPLLRSLTDTDWKLSQLMKYKAAKSWIHVSKSKNDSPTSAAIKAKLPGNLPLAVVVSLVVAALYRVNLFIWYHGEDIQFRWDSIRTYTPPSSSSSTSPPMRALDRRPYIHLLLQGVHVHATRVKGVSAASNEEETKFMKRRLNQLREIVNAIEKVAPAASSYSEAVKSIATELLSGTPVTFGLLGKTKLGKSLIINLLMLLSCVDPYTYTANCRRMAKPEAILQLERELEESKVILRELAASGHGNLPATPTPKASTTTAAAATSSSSPAPPPVAAHARHPTAFKAVHNNDWKEKKLKEKAEQKFYLTASKLQEEAAGFVEPLRRYYAGNPFTQNLVSYILPSKPEGVPCTSVVTSIHYGTVFHLALQYMTEQEVKELAFAHIEPDGYSEEAQRVNKQRYEALCVQHEALEGEDLWAEEATPNYRPPTFEEIKLRPEVMNLCGKTVVYIGRGQNFDADRMYVRYQLEKVMTDKYARFFIRSPRLYVPSSLLASGVILHDIIGTNDPDPFAESQVHAALQDMDVVIAVNDNSLSADKSLKDTLQKSGWLQRAVLSDPNSSDSPHIAFAHYVEAKATVHTKFAAEFKSKKDEVEKLDAALKKDTRDTFNRLLIEEYKKLKAAGIKSNYGDGTINTGGLSKIPTNAWYGTVYPVLFTSLQLNQLSHHETKYSSEEMEDFIDRTKGYELIGLLQRYSRLRLFNVLAPLVHEAPNCPSLVDSLLKIVQDQITTLQKPSVAIVAQAMAMGPQSDGVEAKRSSVEPILDMIASYGDMTIGGDVLQGLTLQFAGWYTSVGAIVSEFFNTHYYTKDGICARVSRMAHDTWKKRQSDLTNQTRKFLRKYQNGGRQPVEVYHMFFESFPPFNFEPLLRDITGHLNAEISAKLQAHAITFFIDTIPALSAHRAQLQQMIATHFVSMAPVLNLIVTQFTNHIRNDVIKKCQTVFNRHRREAILTHVCEMYDDMFEEHKKKDRHAEFPLAQLRKNIDDAIDAVIRESVAETQKHIESSIRGYMKTDILPHVVKQHGAAAAAATMATIKATKKPAKSKALFESLVMSFINQVQLYASSSASVSSSSSSPASLLLSPSQRGAVAGRATAMTVATPETKTPAIVASLSLAVSPSDDNAPNIDALTRLAKELEDWKHDFSPHYQDLLDTNPAELGPAALESLRRRLLHHELTSSNHRIPQGRERCVIVSRKVAAACRYVETPSKKASFTPCAHPSDVALTKIQATLRAYDLEVADSKDTQPLPPSGESFFHALAHQLFGDRQNDKTMTRSQYFLSSDHTKQFIANERTAWYHIAHRDVRIRLEDTVSTIGQFVCAFLNTKHGGEVWIGVDDDGVQGINVGNSEWLHEYQMRIAQQIDMIIGDPSLRQRLVTYTDLVVNKRSNTSKSVKGNAYRNHPEHRVFHVKIESGWEHKSSWLMGGKGYSGRDRAELTPVDLVSRQTEWLTQKSMNQLSKGPSGLPVSSLSRSPSQGLRAAANRQTLRWYASAEKHAEFYKVWGKTLDDYIGKMNLDATPISFIELFSICHLFKANIILWSADAPPLAFCFKRIFKDKVAGPSATPMETKQPAAAATRPTTTSRVSSSSVSLAGSKQPAAGSPASGHIHSGILKSSHDVRQLVAGDESVQFAYVQVGDDAQGEPLYRFYSVVNSANTTPPAHGFDRDHDPPPTVQFNLPGSSTSTPSVARSTTAAPAHSTPSVTPSSSNHNAYGHGHGGNGNGNGNGHNRGPRPTDPRRNHHHDRERDDRTDRTSRDNRPYHGHTSRTSNGDSGSNRNRGNHGHGGTGQVTGRGYTTSARNRSSRGPDYGLNAPAAATNTAQSRSSHTHHHSSSAASHHRDPSPPLRPSWI